MPARPFSLYIHLPWCVKKCPYCDFNSHALKTELPETDYIAALLADLDQELPWVTDRPLTTVFFGGGTPSLFSAAGIGRILDGVRARLVCDPDWEVTLETNPGTVEHGRFAEYKQAGVNRISLGVQSFDNAALTSLGRIHDARQAQYAIEELHTAGLDNFNMDLMFGLPTRTGTQNEQQAIADIKQAIAAEPAH
ncbi:MAG TPA: radical SAM family heme chaperone HemW, partial [Gammaproteobacteria bacterium]|nr:radical SAM family heme chaperone HemW [Gammaproteobacteria bacterium]